MTLTTRGFGRARLEESGPWAIQIDMGVPPRTRLWVRPVGTAPTWPEVDRALAHVGYTREGPASSADPRDGTEFSVRGWVSLPGRGRFRAEPDPDTVSRTDTVAVSLLATELAGAQEALDALQSSSPWHRGELVALRTALDEAGTVTVLLPVDVASSLLSTLMVIESWRTKIGDDAVRALRDLYHRLEHGRLVADSSPRVTDTLRTAMGEALSHPGAEGLTARDELLALIDRFADAHRTATVADDAVQQRLQAERIEQTEPEAPGSAR
ncbi:hypothetical protein AB0M32_19265 [Streptomyces sp. NPDC051985]|uniref:hypothetical protein n=1 Tax=Streptomyces sp. NPDC051985 TaxID=3155807 RepID=UPI00341585D9